MNRNYLRDHAQCAIFRLKYVRKAFKGLWFDGIRLQDAAVPNGLYRYELRHGDDLSAPRSVSSKGVLVNFCGTLLTKEPLPIIEEKSITMFGIDPDSSIPTIGWLRK